MAGLERPHVAATPAPQPEAEREADTPGLMAAPETAEVDAAPSEWRTLHEHRPRERPRTEPREPNNTNDPIYPGKRGPHSPLN